LHDHAHVALRRGSRAVDDLHVSDRDDGLRVGYEGCVVRREVRNRWWRLLRVGADAQAGEGQRADQTARAENTGHGRLAAPEGAAKMNQATCEGNSAAARLAPFQMCSTA